ncbi:MAG: 2-dehydropantoate 2-reductase [Anaerolineales bacterium]|nr:2-dehydropantoate 2-reductase [Anaerolineales bacterium]
MGRTAGAAGRRRVNVDAELLIVGTGALATLTAQRLAAVGVNVVMLGTWPAGIAALNEHGAALVETDGSVQSAPVQATNDPAAVGNIRYALVLVKAWQTEHTARQLAQCLPADGLALTLQNGLGNRENLVAQLGEERVALGTTTTGATLLGPGRVRSGGEGPIMLGAHPRLAPLADLLRQAAFQVNVLADIGPLLWDKLMLNAAINPLAALLNVPNGELFKRPTARQLMIALAEETAAVARAQSITLSFTDPAETVVAIAKQTQQNIASMLQDVRRGAPTEIDAINGAVVRAGRQVGVDTPVNETMWHLVKALSNEPLSD